MIDPDTLPARRPDDMRGPLCFVRPLPAELQRLEDSTHDLDVRLTHGRGNYVRPATATERDLLTAVGYNVPVSTDVRVKVVPGSIVCRTFIDAATEQEISHV